MRQHPGTNRKRIAAKTRNGPSAVPSANGVVCAIAGPGRARRADGDGENGRHLFASGRSCLDNGQRNMQRQAAINGNNVRHWPIKTLRFPCQGIRWCVFVK